MKNREKLSAIMTTQAIYELPKEKLWRGFCHPYDVTCTAKTYKSVEKKLKGLIGAYESELKIFKNSSKLYKNNLSDEQDQMVLEKVREHIGKKGKKIENKNILKDPMYSVQRKVLC